MKCIAVGAVLALPVAVIAAGEHGSVKLAYFVWWAIISGAAYFLLKKPKG